MNQNIITDYQNKEEWNLFIKKSTTGHLLQTWEYGEVRRLMGTKIFRVAITEDDVIVAAAQMSQHAIPHLPYHIGYVPRGPVCDTNPEKYLPILIDGFSQLAQEKNLAFIKCEPNVAHNSDSASVWKEVFVRLGNKSPNPRFMHATSVIDVTKSEEELLATCRKNTRYAINKSQREHVEFIEASNNPAEGTQHAMTLQDGIDAFYELLLQTSRRQGFQLASRPKRYFELLSEQFKENVHLYFAYINDEPVATVLNIYNSTTAYYPYGASSVKAHGTTVTEGLMWHSIMKAKESGCTSYDLWGVLPQEDKKHPYWGYTFFKNGFGGSLVEFIGTYDIPFTKLYYPLQVAEKLRRMYLQR